MKAVHEPDVRERQARGAPEAHGARPGRHAFADHETRPRPVAHAQVGRALVRDTSPWEETPTAEAPMEDTAASATTHHPGAPETDQVLARYLGRSAVLPCSVLPRNKRWGGGSPAGSGASAGPCTPHRWPCRRCTGSGSRWSRRQSPCTRSCRPAQGRRLTRRRNGRTSDRSSGICRRSPPRCAVWRSRTGRPRGGAGTRGAAPRVAASGARG